MRSQFPRHLLFWFFDKMYYHCRAGTELNRATGLVCGSGYDQQNRSLTKERENMPKMKTNRAAAKRFRKTGTGKLVFSKSFASHILTKKTAKRKRQLRKKQLLTKANQKQVRRMLAKG